MSIARCIAPVAASMLALVLGACNEQIGVVDGNYVAVFESRGTLQCDSTGEKTPQQSGLKLVQQGLDVRRSGCGVMTNVAFPAVCGGLTGEILLHDIPLVSLDVAERSGFKGVETLKSGYVWVDCETRKVLP